MTPKNTNQRKQLKNHLRDELQAWTKYIGTGLISAKFTPLPKSQCCFECPAGLHALSKQH